MANTFKGLMYIKHGRVGTRSEGPDYLLQTKTGDYALRLNDRHPWTLDYQLEFYCRRIVKVTGKVDDSVTPPMIQVSSIVPLLAERLP